MLAFKTSLLLAFLSMSTCSSTPSCEDLVPKGTQKPFPDIFSLYASGSTTFGLKAELNFGNQKIDTTIYFEEYYNIGEKKGKIRLFATDFQSDHKDYMYDVKTNEFFTVYDGWCGTDDIDSAQPFEFYQLNRWRDVEADGGNVLFGPSGHLRRAFLNTKNSSIHTVYGGRSEDIRGIPSHYWIQCDEKNPNLSDKYYFSLPKEEQTSKGSQQRSVPLRAVTISLAKNYEAEMFNRTLEFFWLSALPSDEVFRVPDGVGCKRNIDPNDYPPVPEFDETDQLFSGEIVFSDTNSDTKYITTFLVAKDYVSNIVMQKSAEWRYEDGYAVPEAPLKHVYIQNAGVSYAINLTDGSCALSQDAYTGNILLPDGSYLSLEDEHFFTYSEGFTFMNKNVTIRNLPTIQFEKFVHTFKMQGVSRDFTYYKAVITRHYLMDGIHYVREDGTENAPISYIMRLYDKDLKIQKEITVNFFRFLTTIDKSHEVFSVEPCFPDEFGYTWVEVGFPVPLGIDWNKRIYPQMSRVESEFLGFVHFHTRANPSRIPQVKVYSDNGSLIFIAAKILEKYPYELDFAGNDGQEPKEVVALYPLLTFTECAERCQEFEYLCEGFSICFSGACMLTKKSFEVKNSSTCTFYERMRKDYLEPTKREIIDEIKTSVDTGALKLEFPPEEGTREDEIPLTASFFKIGLTQDGRKDDLQEIKKDSRFKGFKQGYKFIIGSEKQLALVQCKELCYRDPTCESLSFCMSDSSCTFSPNHYTEIEDKMVVKKSFCSILGKTYLERFEKQEGVMLWSTAKRTSSNRTIEQCAKECIKEKDFACHSFDLCEGDCNLHEKHFTDIIDKKKGYLSKRCLHLSLNFMYDFKVDSETRIAGEVDAILDDVTAEQCARSCIENLGFPCREFDHCQDITSRNGRGKCRLRENYGNKAVATDSCIRSIRKNAPLQVNNGESDLHSVGLGAGLGMLFFALGAVVSIVAIICFGHFKTSK